MKLASHEVLRRLSQLEAKVDPMLFATPSRDGEERSAARRNAGRLATGTVIVASGAAGHKLIQHHYGGQGAESYRTAGRDAANSAKVAVGDLAKKVRNTDAGYRIEGGTRAAENAVRTGVSRAAKAVKKVGSKLRGLEAGHGVAGRMIQLDAQIDRLLEGV